MSSENIVHVNISQYVEPFAAEIMEFCEKRYMDMHNEEYEKWLDMEYMKSLNRL